MALLPVCQEKNQVWGEILLIATHSQLKGSQLYGPAL